MSHYPGTENLAVMAHAVNYNRFLLQLVLRHAPKNQRMIDFGAGIGTFAKQLIQEGQSILAIEPDPDQRAMIEREGIEAVAHLETLPDGQADYIYTLNVLEHIEDDQAAIHTCFAKLKQGGRLFIYVPAFPSLFSSMDAKVGHFRRYLKHDLRQQVAQAGFAVEACRYADSLGYFATLLFKWLDQRNDGSFSVWQVLIYDRLFFPLSRLLDCICSPFFGKNLLVIARKP